jgi:hypothetical protein
MSAMAVPGSMPPAPPRRPRPRAAWFFVGGALILLGVVAFVVLLLLTVSRASQTDDIATTGPAGQPVRLEVTPDEKRMLFAVEGEPTPRCTVLDADGRTVPVDGVTGTVTVDSDGTTWSGFGTFTAGTSEVTLTCPDAASGQQLRVGAALGVGFVGGLVATILVPLVLAGAGAAVLLVTTILWALRPPRN